MKCSLHKHCTLFVFTWCCFQEELRSYTVLIHSYKQTLDENPILPTAFLKLLTRHQNGEYYLVTKREAKIYRVGKVLQFREKLKGWTNAVLEMRCSRNVQSRAPYKKWCSRSPY